MRAREPERVHETDRVLGHVVERVRRPYGKPKPGGEQQRPDAKRPGARHLVESPTSRLSKRMTRKPRPAKLAENASGQATSCIARPMIKTIGEPFAGPVSSYSRVRP